MVCSKVSSDHVKMISQSPNQCHGFGSEKKLMKEIKITKKMAQNGWKR